MDILGSVTGLVSQGLWVIIPFLVVLTVVVFVHELGHFMAGRLFGVKIDSFSIGFGRELFGWTDRHGTRWRVAALPLGGYVKFWGDADVTTGRADEEKLAKASNVDRKASFHHQPLHAKAVIAAAGPFANFVLAIFILTLIYVAFGERIIPPRAQEILAGSPAEAAGMKAGDLITAVDGRKVRTFSELVQIVSLSEGVPLTLTIDRNGGEKKIVVAPKMSEVDDSQGGKISTPTIGIKLDRRSIESNKLETVYYHPASALVKASGDVWYICVKILEFLGQLVTGTGDVRQLSGPIGIAKVSSDIAQVSLVGLVQLIAVLSVSIGLLNLLPIPILDGGHLLYYAIEAVRGQPLGERAQEIGLQIGLALVLMMMLVATWNDLMKFQLF